MPQRRNRRRPAKLCEPNAVVPTRRFFCLTRPGLRPYIYRTDRSRASIDASQEWPAAGHGIATQGWGPPAPVAHPVCPALAGRAGMFRRTCVHHGLRPRRSIRAPLLNRGVSEMPHVPTGSDCGDLRMHLPRNTSRRRHSFSSTLLTLVSPSPAPCPIVSPRFAARGARLSALSAGPRAGSGTRRSRRTGWTRRTGGLKHESERGDTNHLAQPR